jgi:uncharacterized OB-fold protein
MADRSRCPNCGERVSPFAAGCAVCGADLDMERWDTGPGVGKRVGSYLSGISYGAWTPAVKVIVAVVLVVTFGPVLLAMLGLL